MMKNIHTKFTDNMSFYQWLIDYLSVNNQVVNDGSLIEDFLKREKIGSIEIMLGVVLPHIENKSVLQSSFYHFELNNRIEEWNNNIRNVNDVFLIIMKEDENTEKKKRIRDLMIKEYTIMNNYIGDDFFGIS